MCQKIQMSMSAVTYRLSGFIPGKVAVKRLERLRACCGALSGILVTALVGHTLLGHAQALPFLVAPMGASAVLLFSLPSSPLAQLWSVLGGNLVSAAVGVACALWNNDPNIAAAVAVAGAIAGVCLRCRGCDFYVFFCLIISANDDSGHDYIFQFCLVARYRKTDKKFNRSYVFIAHKLFGAQEFFRQLQ